MITWGRSKLTLLPVVIAISWFTLPNQLATVIDHTALEGSIGGPIVDSNVVYGGKCAICHGKDGAGLPNWKSKGQPDFTKIEWQKAHTDQQISDSIKNGKGKFMPAFKDKLSDEETAALVQRIRAFAKGK